MFYAKCLIAVAVQDQVDSDTRMIASLVNADRSAWQEFVRQYARIVSHAVRQTFRYRGIDVAEAEVEDSTQEVFLKLTRDNFRLLRRFDARRARFSTWLMAIGRNHAIDQIRRRQVRQRAEQEAVVTWQHSESDPHCERRAIPMNTLSRREKEILELLYQADLSVTEVSGMLGIAAQTVRSLRSKAFLKLRAILGEPTNERMVGERHE